MVIFGEKKAHNAYPNISFLLKSPSVSSGSQKSLTSLLHLSLVSEDCILLNMHQGFGLWCLNATFNNTSVMSWRSVLLVEETGENNRPAAGH